GAQECNAAATQAVDAWSGDGGAARATATSWPQPRTETERGSGTNAAARGAAEDSACGSPGTGTRRAALSAWWPVSEKVSALIAHIVLFRLRPDVPAEDRRALIDVWAAALNDMPMIRRARVGRRLTVGRSYESL